jgi:hypothetical protein
MRELFIDWIFSLTENERWVIGFFALLIVTLVGHWFSQRLSHNLAILREQKSRFKDASIEFRSAFMDELSILESGNGTTIKTRQCLLDAFKKHSKAVVIFRQYVPLFKRRNFDKVWHEYYYGQKFDPVKWEFKERNFLQYIEVNDEQEIIARNLAIKNIRALLNFST